MRTFVLIFILTFIGMAWASWLFRYAPYSPPDAFAITVPDNFEAIGMSFDRWTGCLIIFGGPPSVIKRCPDTK
jgi:hypothetical protein